MSVLHFEVKPLRMLLGVKIKFQPELVIVLAAIHRAKMKEELYEGIPFENS